MRRKPVDASSSQSAGSEETHEAREQGWMYAQSNLKSWDDIFKLTIAQCPNSFGEGNSKPRQTFRRTVVTLNHDPENHLKRARDASHLAASHYGCPEGPSRSQQHLILAHKTTLTFLLAGCLVDSIQKDISTGPHTHNHQLQEHIVEGATSSSQRTPIQWIHSLQTL